MGAHLAEGRIKSKEYVVEGLENGPRGAWTLVGPPALTTRAAFVDMMSGSSDAVEHTPDRSGKNFGKTVVRVAKL